MEPTSSSCYLVATPRVIELWEAVRRPRITASRIVTTSRLWTRTDRGRRKKVAEPVELVKFTIHAKGLRLLSLETRMVSYWTLVNFMASRVRNRFSYVRFGRVYGDPKQEKGQRYLITRITRPQADEIVRVFTPRTGQ